IEQGVAGKVIWVEGNRMPSESIDGKPVREEEVGITREIHVYPLAKMMQVQVVEDVFYTNFPTKPIATTLSDEQGCFEVALDAGSYTLVVKEKKGFYGNLFDGEGHIYPITVKPNGVTTVRFKVDYMATY
ncbi:MAG: carboxypeptidase-like regulatory domain-containing protein, partial [Bacteroidota bacterium]